MADVFEPLIEPQDYQAIRILLHPQLPYAFDEWVRIQTEKEWNNLKVGLGIKKVKIDPEEFARYLSATGDKHTPDALGRFAAIIHNGKQRY